MLLTAQPGAGKTVLMAWLADWLAREGSNRHHYFIPRYFIRHDKTLLRSGDAHSFLFALGHQLAALHPALFRPENLEVVVKQRVDQSGGKVVGIWVEDLRISPFYQTALKVEQDVKNFAGEVKGLFAEKVVAEKRFLEIENLQYLALLDPAELLLKQDPNARIIILIDALDELGELRNKSEQNNILRWLAECPELPPNVRFVLTSRPERALELFKQRQKQWLREETIDLQSEQVQTDLRCYTEKFLSQEAVKLVLTQQEITAQKFTVQIVTKANGNFQYMAAFFRAIEQAQAENQQEQLNRLLKLAELPAGLQELYAFFLKLIWDSVQNDKVEIGDNYDEQPAWEWLYQPILGILSVAREPLEAKQIANLGRIKVENRWLQTALGRLGQFFERVSDRYQLYHTTFPEFLTSSQTETNYPDYYLKPSEWHSKIVAYYHQDKKAKWDDIEWTKTDDYGLLHLPVHLYSAGKKENLYTLLTGSPKWMEAKSNKFGDAAYVDDLELAIDDFADPLEEPTQILTLVKLYTARQVIYQRVNISNLETLVWLGRKTEALSHARLSHDPKSKFDALLTIHHALQGKKQPDPAVLDEAEKVAEEIPDNLDKVDALIELAAALVQSGGSDKAKDFCHKAKEVAQKIQDDDYKAKTLINLAAVLVNVEDFTEAEKVASVAKNAVDSIGRYRYKAERLVELAEVVAKIGCKTRTTTNAEDLFKEARSVANKDEDGWRRAHALTKLATALARTKLRDTDSDTDSVFEETQQVAEAIPEYWRRLDRLITLAVALAQTERKAQAKNILNNVLNSIDKETLLIDSDRSQLAIALARVEDFNMAKKVADSIQNKVQRVEAFSQLAVLAYDKGENKAEKIFFDEAWQVTDEIEEGWDKVSALSELAKALDLKINLLEEKNSLEETGDFSTAEKMITAVDEIKKIVYEIIAKADNMETTIQESRRKPEVLIQLAAVLAETESDENKVDLIFQEAEQAVRNKKKNLDRAEALSKLAVALVQSGRDAKRILTDLDQLIQEIIDTKSEKQASEVGNEVEKLPKATTEEDKKGKEEEVLLKLTENLAQARDFSRAEKIANAIQKDMLKAIALSKLAAELAQAQEFSQAEETLEKIKDEPVKARALSKLAVALAQAQKFSQAEETLEKIKHKPAKAWALSKLAVALAHSNNEKTDVLFSEAQKIAFDIEDNNDDKPEILIELVADLARTGKFTEAREIVNLIQKNYAKARALSKLATAYVLTNDSDQAKKVAYQAETFASTSEGRFYKLWAMEELTITLAQIKFFKKVFSIMETQEDFSKFLVNLIELQSAFNNIDPVFSSTILKESIHIYGIFERENSGWDKIDMILSCNTKLSGMIEKDKVHTNLT